MLEIKVSCWGDTEYIIIVKGSNHIFNHPSTNIFHTVTSGALTRVDLITRTRRQYENHHCLQRNHMHRFILLHLEHARVYVGTGNCSSTSSTPDVLFRLHLRMHKEPQQDLKAFQQIEYKDRFIWIFSVFVL